MKPVFTWIFFFSNFSGHLNEINCVKHSGRRTIEFDVCSFFFLCEKKIFAVLIHDNDTCNTNCRQSVHITVAFATILHFYLHIFFLVREWFIRWWRRKRPKPLNANVVIDINSLPIAFVCHSYVLWTGLFMRLIPYIWGGDAVCGTSNKMICTRCVRSTKKRMN